MPVSGWRKSADGERGRRSAPPPREILAGTRGWDRQGHEVPRRSPRNRFGGQLELSSVVLSVVESREKCEGGKGTVRFIHTIALLARSFLTLSGIRF